MGAARPEHNTTYDGTFHGAREMKFLTLRKLRNVCYLHITFIIRTLFVRSY